MVAAQLPVLPPTHTDLRDWTLDEDEGSITINVQATRVEFGGLDCTRFILVNET